MNLKTIFFSNRLIRINLKFGKTYRVISDGERWSDVTRVIKMRQTGVSRIENKIAADPEEIYSWEDKLTKQKIKNKNGFLSE